MGLESVLKGVSVGSQAGYEINYVIGFVLVVALDPFAADIRVAVYQSLYIFHAVPVCAGPKASESHAESVLAIGDDQGRVKGMECLQMELGAPDSSGRRRPVPIEGSEFTMNIDMAVVAIGQSPNPLIPQTTPQLDVGKWGNIEVDWDTMKTSMEGVYAGGDIIRGGATVILAMGDGRIAAEEIHKYLESKT